MEMITRARAVAVVALVLAASASACSDGGPCEPRQAVVTDIDETLTTLDGEYLEQFTTPGYDPAERPDAAELMNGYADLGYVVLYITARGADLTLADGRSAREATSDWLEAHGFPLASPEDLYLADFTVSGSAAVDYKAGVLADRAAEGWRFEYAYGNASTDIEAFREAGISDERIFHVGRHAGTIDGVQPVPDDEAYTGHMEAQLPTVPSASCD